MTSPSPKPATARVTDRATDRAAPLPADDPELASLDLRGLRERWAQAAGRGPIGAEQMTGADLRAQAMGVSGKRLMEQAGAAVGAGVKALADATGRWGKGPILIFAGPGNNGGDGLVAARWLARAGAEVAVVLVATTPRPTTPDAARNWDRLDNQPRVQRLLAGSPRELGVLTRDVAKSSIVVDALLGTGVRGELREPIRSAVQLIAKARAAGVPIAAVDTPTAVDLSSGEPSDPVVQADLTITFHRPKQGLLARRGAAQAGKVLVAPIGIPLEADRG